MSPVSDLHLIDTCAFINSETEQHFKMALKLFQWPFKN